MLQSRHFPELERALTPEFVCEAKGRGTPCKQFQALGATTGGQGESVITLIVGLNGIRMRVLWTEKHKVKERT